MSRDPFKDGSDLRRDIRLRGELYKRLTRRFERAKLQCPTLTIVTHKPSVFVARRLGHELIFSKGAEQKLLVGEIRRRQIPNGDRPQPFDTVRFGSDSPRPHAVDNFEASIDEVIDNVVSTFMRETETPD